MRADATSVGRYNPVQARPAAAYRPIGRPAGRRAGSCVRYPCQIRCGPRRRAASRARGVPVNVAVVFSRGFVVAGNGFQVDLDALETFQQGLGNLINEHFAETGPANPTCLTQNTTLQASDFGEFPEAHSLAARYEEVRANITQLYTKVSQQVQQMQSVAKRTKQNYQDADDQAKGHVTSVNGSGSSSTSAAASSPSSPSATTQSASSAASQAYGAV